MSSLSDDARHELLKAEYLKLLEITERFDEKAIVIKGWSITLSTAAVGAGFLKSLPVLWWLAALGALFFWAIEAFWKSFQMAHYARLREIESYFNGSRPDIDPLQVHTSWFSAWRAGVRSSWPRRMLEIHVALPHAAIVMICCAAVLFS